MSNRAERHIANLNIKCSSISDSVASTAPTLSTGDKLAQIGVCFRQEPLGFSVLIAEIHNDIKLKDEIEGVVLNKFQTSLKTFRGSVADVVPYALTKLAMQELMSENGLLCGECNGTGLQKRKNKNEHRPCQACDHGFVEWSDAQRYGFFCYQLPIKMERFNKLMKHYREIMEELKKSRRYALFILDEQLEKESKVA